MDNGYKKVKKASTLIWRLLMVAGHLVEAAEKVGAIIAHAMNLGNPCHLQASRSASPDSGS